MSDIESKMKEENEFNKELFNFNGYEPQHLKELFTRSLKNSINDPNSFIQLLDNYSKCRPDQHNISKELVECVFSYFPEQIYEIQQEIKQTKILKFIIFPEEFPRKGSKEQNEIFLLLQKDDIDGFISFLSKNPTIDITEEQKLEYERYYSYLFDYCVFISLIDFCCLFGSLKCFKYLLLNKCEITKKHLNVQLQEEIKKLLIFSKKMDIHLKNV